MTGQERRKQTAREIAAKVVHDVLTSDVFSNRRLSDLLDQSGLDSRDRNFCAELVYGTLRWSEALEDSLRSAMDKPGKIPPRVMAQWLVAAYQLQHLSDTIPAHAVVNEAVSVVKRFAPGLSGLTNAILRKLGSPKYQMLSLERATAPEVAKAYSLPQSLVQCIDATLPKSERVAAVNAFNERPRTAFRVYRETPKSFVPHAFVPGAYFGDESGELKSLLKGNSVVVQDPASQVAALLVAPKEAASVIDMCSAPGMKSLILASLAKTGVVAVEVNAAKKERMIANRKRIGGKIDIQIRDATKLHLDEGMKSKFDAVLLDAPCSGVGTIRRHPEIRRRHSDEKLAEIVTLQRKLLESASKLLKKGGVLVYSVCSPLTQEGSEQIAWFLKEYPEFKIDNPKNTLPWLPDDAVTDQNFVALWPHRHDSDAFFAARLILDPNPA